jgi:hypothetical protein
LDLLARMATMSCLQMLLLGFFNGEHAVRLTIVCRASVHL